ncbi:MAG: outer membrane protein assembly factor BamA [Variibacter sp.]|nr:outer membrane protein assembly factor BamA [Variibacter sp.]
MRLLVRLLRGAGVAAALIGGSVGINGLSAALPGAAAWAQAASSIVVQGNRRVDAETIRSYFRTGPGERLDAVKIDEAYKALLATGLFEDVRISQSGGRIVVTVVEASVINRIQFEGNRAVKDEQLSAEIQSKPRGPLSRQIVRADVQRIIDIYRAAGRYNVRVEPKYIDRGNGRVDLVFEIDEGKKITVKSIQFVGNRAFSASRLRDVIKTSESGLLSIFRSTDVYDPDRIEADRDLLRRFYLRHGYADVRIVSAVAQFDPSRNGFIVTFTIEEGEPYRFGVVDVQSNVREVDPAALRSLLKMRSGATYDAEAVEKTVESMSIELAKRGYAFAQVRPRGDRNFEARTVDVVFVVDQGPRTYIERIVVRGNTRTRDYVIRREFDIGEGDAYNQALIDRAERRLKNLAYFRSVRITSEPGSAPDRVIVNVDVEEQSTGEFSVAGGYSTADGFLAEVSVAERNLLGRGQFAKASVQYGQRAKGFELSFVEPYLFDYRLAFGVDIFARTILPSSFQSYELRTAGGAVRFGVPITEELSAQLRYSAYTRDIRLDPIFNCFPPSSGCTPAAPALRQAADAGSVLTSLVGYTLAYNTLDNNKNPTKGLLAELKQDFAGVGGDVKFIRTTGDARLYYEVGWDLIALFRVQGGHIASWGGQQLSMLDHFFMGPNLVRGFAPAGIGPRDITPGSTRDALGGTMYWGATVELQYPLFFAPKDFGMKAAVFADAGSLWDYRGIEQFQGQTIIPSDKNVIRSSVGVGLIWESPFGPLRFDYAIPVTTAGRDANGQPIDRIQEFRFSGGTRF